MEAPIDSIESSDPESSGEEREFEDFFNSEAEDAPPSFTPDGKQIIRPRMVRVFKSRPRQKPESCSKEPILEDKCTTIGIGKVTKVSAVRVHARSPREADEMNKSEDEDDSWMDDELFQMCAKFHPSWWGTRASRDAPQDQLATSPQPGAESESHGIRRH